DASLTIDTPRVNGQITQISGVGSNVVSIDYNAQGLVTGVTDSTGRTFTMSQHNHLGQPQWITDPNGINTNASYDVMGRVLNVMRDGEERLSAVYTPAGQPETVTIDGSAFNYTYDSAFRLSGISSADGEQVDVDYLANGLVDRTTHSYNGASRSTAFNYDAEGSVTQTNHTFEDGSLQRTYNSRGQVTQETDGPNTTSYHYDSNAYLTSVTDKGEQTQLQHDALGRLMSLTTDGGQQTTFSYTGLGEQTQQLNSNWGYRNYAYGSTGLLTTETTPLRSNSYNYTASDEVLSRTAQHNDTSIPTITTHYGYNDDSDSVFGKNYGVGRLTASRTATRVTSIATIGKGLSLAY
ncbi:MAG: RHS repeat protein, partial [Arenicella sp.]|nr:RHS repeat protein [Arenicella sp.]